MKKLKTKIRGTFIILAMTLLWLSNASAATINAASCSAADIQTAITAAHDGDTVAIPAGSCTFSSTDTVQLTNKNITVRGAGIDQTILTLEGKAFNIKITDASKGQFRITGMTFTGSTTGQVIWLYAFGAPGAVYGWRIDHNKFDFQTGERTGIYIFGAAYGVIDHNVVIWNTGAWVLANGRMDLDGCSSAAFLDTFCGKTQFELPLGLGGPNAVYIEDNDFTMVNEVGAIGAVYDTAGAAERAVFRYNTVRDSLYYDHWTRNFGIGGILHEIYNNHFICTGLYDGYVARLESGTGVFFNNTITGCQEPAQPYIMLDERRGVGGIETGQYWYACDGTRPWDGNAGDPDAPGWPCAGQIGRAPGISVADMIAGTAKQASAPVYLWNNGREDGCHTGGPCTDVVKVAVYPPVAYVKKTAHPNGEVDYVLNGSMPMPGYTPYTYPHPLATGSISKKPSPPQALQAVQ